MKESMVFYKSFYEAIKNIPPEEQLKLYNAIFEYSFTDKEIELDEGIAKAMFILIKPNIDSANARYKASVENGKRGGRPKKETQEKPNNNLEKTQVKPSNNLEKTQVKPSNNLNDDVDVNDNVNDNDNYNVAIEEITKCYQENIGLVTPATAELIFSYLDTMDYKMILEAIKIASTSNKRTARYINGILKDWENKGFKELADIENEKKSLKKLAKSYDSQREYENLDFLYANMKGE